MLNALTEEDNLIDHTVHLTRTTLSVGTDHAKFCLLDMQLDG